MAKDMTEEYLRKIDSSGRMNIPKQFRDRFDTDIYKVRLSDDELEIVLVPSEVREKTMRQ